MPTARRASRINELIREELSDLIRRQLRDPRIAEVVSITQVAISADLRSAKVYVSTFGEEEAKVKTLKALETAAGFLRRELKPRLAMKTIPTLQFVRDDSIENGARLLSIMNEVGMNEGSAPKPLAVEDDD